MSRPGNPFDNAKAESFMKTLKTEEVNGKAFANIETLAAIVASSQRLQQGATALGARLQIAPRVRSRVRAKQSYDNPHGNRTVTEITVSHLRGAVQHVTVITFDGALPVMLGLFAAAALFAHWDLSWLQEYLPSFRGK